jgi:hypothetical protein
MDLTYASLANSVVNSAGVLSLDRAAISSQNFQQVTITGGRLRTGGGTQTDAIYGGVSITNATVVLGSAVTDFPTLRIQDDGPTNRSNLSMTNTTIQVSVNCQNNQCGSIQVLSDGNGNGGTVSIGNNCTLSWFNANTANPPNIGHTYTVLSTDLQGGGGNPQTDFASWTNGLGDGINRAHQKSSGIFGDVWQLTGTY